MKAVVATPSTSVNLLDWDDVPSAPVQAPSQQQQTLPLLRLRAVEMTPAEYQQRWSVLVDAALPLPNQRLCTLAMVPDQISEVESGMRTVQVII